MKILYVSKSIIPSRTANSINVMKMCQAFADNGHTVTLLAPDIKKRYEKNIENIYKYYGVRKNFYIKKLYHPNIKLGALFYTLAIVFYLIKNQKFDLIYGRFLHGLYVASLFNHKVIYESHVPDFKVRNHKLLIFKRLITSKYFEKMIVISKVLKDMYLERGYLEFNKIQIAHDGADEVDNLDYKIKLLGYEKNLKVGYVGHLYKGKGIEIISSLASSLKSDIEIHIIGGLEKDIQNWKNKINKKNIFFYGFIPHGELSGYINSLDVCLLPNQKLVYSYGADLTKNAINISDFTSPLKLFEYMSHRKAIVASDLPVINEVLNHNNSILVKYDDIQSWIDSIELLRDSKNRDKIATQALRDFSNFTWKKRANSILNINQQSNLKF